MNFKTKWVLGHGVITAIIYSGIFVVVVVYNIFRTYKGHEILLFAGFGVCIGISQGLLLFGIKRPLHALTWAMTTSLAFYGGFYIAAIISITFLLSIYDVDILHWQLILIGFSFITLCTSLLIATIQSALIIFMEIDQNKIDWRQKAKSFWKGIKQIFSMRWFKTSVIAGSFSSLTGTAYLLIATNPRALSYITPLHMGIAQLLAALVLAYFTKDAAQQLHAALNKPVIPIETDMPLSAD